MGENRGYQYPSILEAEEVAKEYENAGKVEVQKDISDEQNLNNINLNDDEKFAKIEAEILKRLEKTLGEKLKKQLNENCEEKLAVKQNETFDHNIQTFSEIKIDDECYTKKSVKNSEKMDAKNSILKSEETKRTWDRPSEFVLLVSLSLFSFHIPFMIYRNGGFAFLIPLSISFFLVGMPLFSLETLLAQYSGKSIVSLLDFCPLFKGIGYALVFTTVLLGLLQNLIFSWILYYISLLYKSPWFGCYHYFNTDKCFEQMSYNNCSYSEYDEEYCVYGIEKTLDVSEFFKNEVLQLSSGFRFGSFHLRLFLCLAVGSIITFLCLFRGIKVLGKLSYILVSAIFIFFFIMFIRSITLPGSATGLSFISTHSLYWLANFSAWVDCLATWLPFSATIIVYSSHNKFNTNFFKQYTIIGGIYLAFVLLSSATFMCFVGHLSYTMGMPMHEVMNSGFKLIFEVMLKALQIIPASNLWIALFFILIFCITLGQTLPGALALSEALEEFLPKNLQKKNFVSVGCVCLFNILFGTLFVFGNGFYIFTLIDNSLIGLFWTVPILFECLALTLFYRLKRLKSNVKDMLGINLNIWFKVMWAAVVPFALVLVTVFYQPNFQYMNVKDYMFPMMAWVFAYIIYATPSLIVFLGAFVVFFRTNGTFLERFRSITKPGEEWETKKNLNSLLVLTDK